MEGSGSFGIGTRSTPNNTACFNNSHSETPRVGSPAASFEGGTGPDLWRGVYWLVGSIL